MKAETKLKSPAGPVAGVVVGDTWYRLEDKILAGWSIDGSDEAVASRTVVELRQYQVRRLTKKGVWLCAKYGAYLDSELRFVLCTAQKRLAHPTIEEALASFERRKARQLEILRAQMTSVERALKLARKQYGAKLQEASATQGEPLREPLVSQVA